MSESRRQIHLYYLYRACTSFGFYVPVSVLYVLDKGFGLAFVALLQAVFSLALLLAEVPTGYVGDRLGRRASIAVGNACRVVGLLGYVVAESAAAFLALKVVFAVGWAFRSGTQDAWLYEVLAAWFDEDEFARVEGRGSTVLLGTSAVTAVAGGLLYGVHTALPFLANAVLSLSAVGVLAVFPSVDGASTPDGQDDDRDEATDSDGRDAPSDEPLGVREALDVLGVQLRRPSIRWVVVYTTLVFLVFDLSRTFEQPALDAAGIPVVGFGLLYAGFKLASAAAASTTGWLQDRLGTRGVLALAAPVVGLAYASLAVVPLAIVPVLFCYRSVRVVLRPVRNQYLNDRLADAGRATVLSGVSMVLSLAGVVARLAGGQVAAVVGPVSFLAVAGVGLTGAAGLLWLAVSPASGDPAETVGQEPVAGD